MTQMKYIFTSLLFASFGFLAISFISLENTWANVGSRNDELVDLSEYLVYGPKCRLREIDPYDPSVFESLHPQSPIVCSLDQPLSFTYTTSGGATLLFLIEDEKKNYKIHPTDNLDCCFTTVTRVSQKRDEYNWECDSVYKETKCERLDSYAELSNTVEYVIIRCDSVTDDHKRRVRVYNNAHAIVSRKPDVAEFLEKSFAKPRENATSLEEEKLSVLLLGVDGVSRLTFHRTAPNTLRYLQRNNWFEFNGYNKIGDNTYPNLMAVLTGRNVSDIESTCLGNGSIKIFDDCPILWKDFEEAGYVTSYAEDEPAMSTFNYLRHGFVDQPTHYYMRPFLKAIYEKLPTRKEYLLPVCLGPQSTADYLFHHARDFAKTFREHPFFGLYWLNSYSHNSVDSLAAIDVKMLNFMKELERSDVLNNTIVVLFSDHGIRFGEFRHSFNGYVEERLPLLLMHVPDRIIEKYPKVGVNMGKNTNRLTTPYDLYVTLKQLLQVEKAIAPACPSCKSFFEEIENSRGCEDASIPDEWCTCNNFRQISTDDEISKMAAEFLYQRILNRTQELVAQEEDKPVCLHRKFHKLHRAHESLPFTGSPNSRNIGVSIETEPYAIYEATVRIDFRSSNPVLEVNGFISRITFYGTTSHCVNSLELKYLCHCEDEDNTH